MGGIAIITLDTVLDCTIPINIQPEHGTILLDCALYLHPGCALLYQYRASDGCSYAVYDSSDCCICDFNAPPVDDTSTHGGGFSIAANMAYITFSANVTLFKAFSVLVSDLIADVADLAALYDRMDAYNIDTTHRQSIVNLYLDAHKCTGTGASVVGYPHIGAIYLSSVEVDPSLLFGGVWSQLSGVFHESIFAYTCTDNGATAIADLAVVDIAICA